MDLQQRINAFVKLGHFLSQFQQNGIKKNDAIESNDLFFDGFKHQIKLAQEHNGWFTNKNVLFALENWSNALTDKNIKLWTEKYNFNLENPKRVAIIMAGNIPLVGFHDFLSVLISGHNVLVKQSSNDKHLLPFLAKYLEVIEPDFKGKIKFTEEKLEDFDAVIATGSDNTARYFEYYFKNKPSIIRKNRNSVAILTGNETHEQLEALSDDIFRYYGLGCRNVSKMFLPKGYNFDAFFNAVYKWHPIINEAKYANNYDYNKAVYIMSEFDILENGFLMIKQDEAYASPIATLFYDYYENITDLQNKIITNKDRIQCVVANGFSDSEIPFGTTQYPQLWEYADNVDTVDFLLKI
ncbi:acyl-CoA reductase LuxC [Winogradskyella epiphytica]|uniref:Acyl-CoA reductase LuxC n=1 Tax=Winogradskyella epiphytica TaxID=262005 RepID=A0A2V4WXJ3_9FLAO|nr:acyl-CoA reductase [Winogradskyella epiphytica]PYE81732.1 acyl-CoA reductase LuxC [Winogradskyella epiphytica]GGW63051.1 acyl-CoA reductase [Winogradskyella epiphytica]